MKTIVSLLSLCGKSALLASLLACAVGVRAAVNVTLSATPNPSAVSQPITLNATVSPADQTGKVTFYDGVSVLGSAPIANGLAKLSTADLGAGVHSLYARFVIGAGEPSGGSNKVTQTVAAKPGGTFVTSASLSLPGFEFQNLTTGDLTGNGRQDIVATTTYVNQTGGTINVFMNEGDGTFASASSYLGGTTCYSVAIADVNLDGVPDLIAATPEGVAVLLGNRDGTFQHESYVLIASDVKQVAVADFNWDGIPDVIVAHGSGKAIDVLLGSGDGSFQSDITTTLAAAADFIAPGDFDNDGIPDVAVASLNGNSISVLYGRGDGTFQTPISIAVDGTTALASADLNGDGIPDLIAGAGGKLVVFTANGNGTFRQTAQVATYPPPSDMLDVVYSITATDVDGDGEIDLLAETYEAGLLMSLGDGNGGLRAPFGVMPIGGWVFVGDVLAVADFNGDGIPDFAVGANQVSPSGSFSICLGVLAPVLTLTATPNPVSVGDNVTLTVTSSYPDATGTLQLQEISELGTNLGTVALSGGSATLMMMKPGTGTHVVVATYSGDSKYAATKTPELAILAQQPGPGITLTASPNPAQVGQPITLTATLAYSGGGKPVGNPEIAFFDGTTPLSAQTVYSNTTTFTTTLPAGTHQLRAVFPEYLGYLPTSATFFEQVLATPGGQLTPGPGFNAGGTPGAMITADVNQDRIADIVFADTNPNQIVVLEGNGDGTFQGPDRTSLSFAPGALVAVQLDIYGWTDLAVTNPAGDSVALLTYAWGGAYSQPYESLAVGTNPVSIATADFNGDGYPDLITANSGSNNVSLLLTMTDPGSFGDAVNLSTGTQPVAVATGDFNGDGNADFVVVDHGSSDLRIFLGNGDGTFLTPSTIPVASGPVAVAVGDLDGDGNADLAVVSAGTGQLSILLGRGNGTFASPATYSVGAGATAVAIVDLNADGKPDLAVSTAAGVLVFYGKGDGSFGSPLMYSQIAGATALVAGDFGEAGRMDLAALSASAKAVLLSLNLVPTTTTLAVTRSAATVNAKVTMTGTVTPAVTGGSVTFYDGVQILASGPVVNGQGSAFITSLAGGSHTILARFTGSPGYGASVSGDVSFTSTPVLAGGLAAPATQILSAPPTNLAASDFNGDGIVDLAMWSLGGGLYGLLGNVHGAFTQVSSPQATGGGSLIACDFNGDGKPDVAYVNAYPTIALGNGDGTFHELNQSYPLSVNSIAAADVNRDGKPDLILTGPNGFVQVLFGNGDGTLQLFPDSYPAGANPTAIAVGDLNNDGIADVVVTNSGSSGPNTISVLLGTPDGTFGAPQSFTSDLDPQALTIADFNGDGNLDVAVIHATQPTVAIFLGKGDGTFKPAAILPISAAPTQIFSADMNGDGVTDLVLFYARSSTAFSILYGNGDGTFQAPVTFPDSRTPYAMVIADVNGDGRPDVVIGSYGAGGGSVDVYLGLPPCPTSISPNASIDGSAQEFTISVVGEAACQWTAQTTAGFATIASGASGSGSGSVVIRVDTNTTGAPRTAQIVVGNWTFTLTQDFTTGQFTDISPSATYFDAANLMFQAGVTTGCVEGSTPQTRSYCPDNTVTRQEMAAFIVRAVTGTTNPAIYNTTPYFQDVPASNPFFPHIQKLMDLGITTGCSKSPALFCPTDTIPRWQMAMFMVRARLALYGASFTSSGTPYFADAPTNVEGNGMPFPYIQRAYEEHVTNGCGSNPLVFCPDGVVTRGQMASFIMRALFNETTIPGPTAPQLTGVSPNAVTLGGQVTVTITGTNTNFQSGDTVTAPSGMLTVSNVVVNSATSIAATLTVNGNAAAGPQALVVTSGGQNLTLPLAIRVGTY
ncbi:MAG: FG-GAP-like repeat-containing protein [Bryobacteraceae bacterium]